MSGICDKEYNIIILDIYLKKMFMRPLVALSVVLLLVTGACQTEKNSMKKIIFLHHSTGYNIWVGGTNKYMYKLTKKGDVAKYISKYNKANKTGYTISEQYFPKESPYGWNNYPFDYYNIWVKHGGTEPYMEEPTLEMLTKNYDVIIFKHCFPGSRILEDTGTPNIDSDEKRMENYKLQYNALKQKMHEFPDKKFIIWTPAVNTKLEMTEDEARRAAEFHTWMTGEWDEKDDNIYIWDFYKYETEGSLYMQDQYSYGPNNSHPNKMFSAKMAPLFGQFIIDVIESPSR
jgi:hypothetical protein